MKWRKVLWWIVVVFALYAVYRAPDQAAGFVRSVGEALGTIVTSVSEFFDGVLNS